MEETPKEKKPRLKLVALTAKSSAKRPSESEVKNSKRTKKKAPKEDVVTDDGAAAPVEEDSKMRRSCFRGCLAKMMSKWFLQSN